jgi:5-methylcytosine-specific restriction enzyme A
VGRVETCPERHDDEFEALEGRLLAQYHRSVERSRELDALRKQHALRSGKALACEVCDFDFAVRYASSR